MMELEALQLEQELALLMEGLEVGFVDDFIKIKYSN
jgi:hypothetical protein